MFRWWHKGLALLRRTKVLHISRRPEMVVIGGNDVRDIDFYYRVWPHERFKDGRYEALHPLGAGRFSYVWLAKDLEKNTYVALKILTWDCFDSDHDTFELQITAKIAEQQRLRDNSGGGSHVVGLLDTFAIRSKQAEHECFVLPVLGAALDTHVWGFTDRKLPFPILKSVTRQILSGLVFLHDRCGVIHTELQGSNICLEVGPHEIARLADGKHVNVVTPMIDETSRVKIIDFGASYWAGDEDKETIQPARLRAPEVYLGAPWGPPVDIWSLGCLVIEWAKGGVVFEGEESKRGGWTAADEHLAICMEVLGPMPPALLKRGSKTAEFFDEDGNLLRIPKLKPTTLESYMASTNPPYSSAADIPEAEAPAFLSFLRIALALDPDQRGTAAQLLEHEWLRM